MKRKSIISMLLLSMMLGMFSTSCQDMLSPNSERHSYAVAEDTLYSYWGILKSLQNIAERYVILNECRGDLVDASGYISDTIAAIVNFGEVSDPEKWKDGACAYLKIADYYHIINSCNAYIAMCDTLRTTGTNKKYMLKEYAQVQAIRAWVYMQLLYAYGENKVPFYKEPMLTTDDIDNFTSNANPTLVNAQVLADELGPDLEAMELIEEELGLPEYNNYGDVNSGNTHFVCHSSKCMFPTSIVLGDLYLLSGKYMDAAQHYYNYINSKYCGPLAVDRCYSTGLLDDTKDYPIYEYDKQNIPYTEKEAVSRSTEAITCIPSNKGKLEGKVLTDINRLFGFEAQLRTNNNENASASVDLSLNYDRELIPSKGYEALCDSQKYEIYVGTTTNNNFQFESLQELPGVGDARRAWIYNDLGRQWTFRVGDDEFYGKMVAKQNPGRGFSTTYPVVYRKSTVWLRFAEALNRAGFPSYAFAILKTGLCENPEWFPTAPGTQYKQIEAQYDQIDGLTDEEKDFHKKFALMQQLSADVFQYPVKDEDSLLCYYDRERGGQLEKQSYLPEGWDTDNQIHHYYDLLLWLDEYFEDEYQAAMQEYQASLETDEPLPEPQRRTIDGSAIRWMPASAESFKNIPAIPYWATVACYYLDRREVERAASTPFLNFKGQPYLRGQSQTQVVFTKEQGKLFNKAVGRTRIPSSTSADRMYTIGVHQRGCGFIRYDDPIQYGRSSYGYVNMVQKKIKEATGREVTAEEIYSGNIDEDVQNAVEDLIIDEMGLELAFEGTRFSDLCRVALRRGKPDYLAERVAKRHTGEVDERLRGWLQDKSHWFLPIPQE